MSYTVAFNGARDNYQVPLALYQNNLLSKLVTDFYTTSLVSPLFKSLPKLLSRQHPELPAQKVESNFEASYVQYLLPRLVQLSGRRLDPPSLGGKVQRILSLKALQRAEETKSNLLLYAGYAFEAFSSPKSAGMKKVLFMYHPHIKLSGEILMRDRAADPDDTSLPRELIEDMKDTENEAELQLADLVICASTFTARSVEHVGIPSSKVAVIPYGIDTSQTPSGKDARQDPGQVNFLFVGSGIHRKGLHLLLRAWARTRLKDAKLTIVARHLETSIQPLLKADNVNYLPGVPPHQLHDLYRTSNVFVLPSLVEGFGYVYLEALAHGCFCIGTENTGLPDLNLPDYAADVIEPGSVNALAAALLKGHALQRDRKLSKAKIAASVKTHTWAQFRSSIATLCQNLEGDTAQKSC